MLELIISMGIMLTVLITAISLGLINSQAGHKVDDQIVAANLTQEGLEAARLIRDNNWLAGANWDKYLYDSSAKGKGAKHDWHSAKISWQGAGFTPLEFVSADNISAGRLYIASTSPMGHYYSHDITVTPTNFYRIVKLDPVCESITECGDGVCEEGEGACVKKIGIRVTSWVRWMDGTKSHDYRLQEFLYNWR